MPTYSKQVFVTNVGPNATQSGVNFTQKFTTNQRALVSFSVLFRGSTMNQTLSFYDQSGAFLYSVPNINVLTTVSWTLADVGSIKVADSQFSGYEIDIIYQIIGWTTEQERDILRASSIFTFAPQLPYITPKVSIAVPAPTVGSQTNGTPPTSGSSVPVTFSIATAGNYILIFLLGAGISFSVSPSSVTATLDSTTLINANATIDNAQGILYVFAITSLTAGNHTATVTYNGGTINALNTGYLGVIPIYVPAGGMVMAQATASGSGGLATGATIDTSGLANAFSTITGISTTFKAITVSITAATEVTGHFGTVFSDNLGVVLQSLTITTVPVSNVSTGLLSTGTTVSSGTDTYVAIGSQNRFAIIYLASVVLQP